MVPTTYGATYTGDVDLTNSNGNANTGLTVTAVKLNQAPLSITSTNGTFGNTAHADHERRLGDGHRLLRGRQRRLGVWVQHLERAAQLDQRRFLAS